MKPFVKFSLSDEKACTLFMYLVSYRSPSSPSLNEFPHGRNEFPRGRNEFPHGRNELACWEVYTTPTVRAYDQPAMTKLYSLSQEHIASPEIIETLLNHAICILDNTTTYHVVLGDDASERISFMAVGDYNPGIIHHGLPVQIEIFLKNPHGTRDDLCSVAYQFITKNLTQSTSIFDEIS